MERTREQKVRRATACCKLAARILPRNIGEPEIEALARVLMGVADSFYEEIVDDAHRVVEVMSS